MIGHEGVVRYVVRMLKDKLPATIAELERDLGLSAGAIPRIAPKNFHPAWEDVVAKGSFPSLMILQDDSETRNTGRQVSSYGDYDEYEWTYPLRLILHNVGAANGETELERKRLMLALRMALLRNRGLMESDDESAVIHPESLREMFNGGAVGEHQKLLLESTVLVRVNTNEILSSGPGNRGSQTIRKNYGIL